MGREEHDQRDAEEIRKWNNANFVVGNTRQEWNFNS